MPASASPISGRLDRVGVRVGVRVKVGVGVRVKVGVGVGVRARGTARRPSPRFRTKGRTGCAG